MVAVGTGQAIDMARGAMPTLFVHDRAAEEKYVADGFRAAPLPGHVQRLRARGPKADPVGVKGNDIVEALKKIAAANASFISRGDKSGTMRRRSASGAGRRGRGSGYKECGCGWDRR